MTGDDGSCASRAARAAAFGAASGGALGAARAISAVHGAADFMRQEVKVIAERFGK